MKIFVKSELQLPCFHSQILWTNKELLKLLKEFIHHMELQKIAYHANAAVQDRLCLSDIYPRQAIMCITHKIYIYRTKLDSIICVLFLCLYYMSI